MPVTIPFLAQFARAPQKQSQTTSKSAAGNGIQTLPPPSTRFTEVKDETTDDL